MRTRYVIANWKMNVPPEGIDAYLRALSGAQRAAQLCVAPPFVYVRGIAYTAPSNVMVGAQNCGDQSSGAFTGEVSAAMLRESGASFAIVGHSERRNVYGESDALVARRMAMALEHGLLPVLCIGENLETREAGRVAEFLNAQLQAAVTPEFQRASNVVIAYEPIWAIGTGRNATGAMCGETAREIRDAVRRLWPSSLHDVPLLYGGSVTPDNVAELVRDGNIDGFLVGGASLDSKKLLAIHAAIAG